MKTRKFFTLLTAVFCAFLMTEFSGCSHKAGSEDDDGGSKKENPYITFTGNEAFSLCIGSYGSKFWNGIVYYCNSKPELDSSWSEWNGTDEIPAAASKGKYYVYLRGSGNTAFATDEDNTTCLDFNENDADNTLKVECSGNIMTLLDYKNPDAVVMGNYCFNCLFLWCEKLTKAPSLPAMSLSDNCYNFMFCNCTALTAAPELPATTLANHCYDSMFYGCTGLKTVPDLNASTLATSCYNSMFYGCTNLTAAKKLGAETLADSCYLSMFEGCTGLTASPEIAATTFASQSCTTMFNGCSGLTSVGRIGSGSTIKPTDNAMYQMFSGCSKLSIEVTTGTDGFMTLGIGTDPVALTGMFENWTPPASITAPVSYRVKASD